MQDTVQVEGTSSEIMRDIAVSLQSLRSLPELLESLKAGAGQAKENAVSKEQMAIGLLFTSDSPTKTEIARAVGLKNHSGMHRWKRFNYAWACFELGKSFEAGHYRPAGKRRNGREMSGEDDGTED